MVKETIDAVLQAELEAEQIEKNALELRERIIEEAHSSAQKLISGMEKDASEKALRDSELARRRGEEIIVSHERIAQVEISRIREQIKSRKSAAIEMVISELT
ncbi:MAG: hypothetical protein PHX37_01200 [Eubacteriales bacterium]|nr:hypothetical protein [Eubacteriales bacterium]